MKISIGNLPLKNIDADVFLHPVKYKHSIAYEPMAEEAVIALIAKHFVYNNVSADIKEYFDELDDGYLFSESNLDETDLDKLDKGEIIIGKDILLHPKFKNINNFLVLLRDFASFKISGIELKEFTELDEIDELDSFDQSVVYTCNDTSIVKEDELLCSKQFMIANRINPKMKEVTINNEIKKIKLVEDLKGTFGVIYKNVNDYPFLRVTIKPL